uniref:Uncharacterized protein n=1 Tax=Tetraselmis sp. GSL018 TaxID=582737 RepID=A0A061R1I8_9CHLO|mmetsp:Transcript_33712/g.80025  ORF Transcript_33712/g.80025 Transcript_33712/m.80025 type:complete len:228 (-) Transcript_33712:21-704(-)
MVAEQQAPDVPLDGCLNLGGPHMHPLACGAQLCGRRDRDRGRKPPRVYLLRGLRPLRAGQGNHGAGLRRVRVWDADDPPAHPPALPWVHLQRLLDVLRFRLRHHPTAVVCFPRAGDPEPGGHLRGRVAARQEDAEDAQPRHRRHSRALTLFASSPPPPVPPSFPNLSTLSSSHQSPQTPCVSFIHKTAAHLEAAAAAAEAAALLRSPTSAAAAPPAAARSRLHVTGP